MQNTNEIRKQVELYFSALHLHKEGLKGGVFTHMEKNKFKEQYSFGYDKTVKNVTALLEKGERPVFVTLNSYKKSNPHHKYCKRDDKNLWGIDTIMIDIDAPTQLLGVEDELIDILKWAWELKKIPKPNLYSFTGSGGVHLYYCFERLPKTMQASINALKWGIAEKIIDFEDEFPMREGHSYKVDTKIFDNQRLDRIPGSIHEDTGVMCRCFLTGQNKYTYKELLTYFEEDHWRAEYKIQDARKYINKRRGIHPSTPSISQPSIKTIHPINYSSLAPLTPNEITIDDIRLTKKRIKALFILASKGKDFKNCREVACFILRNWCMQLKYSDNLTKETLIKFNSLLKNPLSNKELFNNTRSIKLYKFTNNYLKHALNLSEDEMIVFTKKYRPGDRKERTIIDKVNIAKLLVKGFTSEQICEKLSISLSLLKRRRAEMKKNEGLLYWANYKIAKEAKTILTIVKQIAEKVGIRTTNFRKFIESIIDNTKDIVKMCKDKCDGLVDLLFDYIKHKKFSIEYG